MKLKTITKAAETRAALGSALAGLPFEISTTDENLTAIRIGGLHIGHNPYGAGLKISRVIEHEEAERYRVRVDHPHFATINRYFEDETGPARDLAASFGSIADATVTKGMVTVQVDDTGKVIAEIEGETVKPLAKQDNGDDIPF